MNFKELILIFLAAHVADRMVLYMARAVDVTTDLIYRIMKDFLEKRGYND